MSKSQEKRIATQSDTVHNPIYCQHCGRVRFYNRKTGEGAPYCAECGKLIVEEKG